MTESNGTATAKNLPLNVKGKAAKANIMQRILRQEEANGQHADEKRVLLIVEKELQQYPPEQREGVKFFRHDIHQARSVIKLARKKSPPGNTDYPLNRVGVGRGKINHVELIRHLIEEEIRQGKQPDRADILKRADKLIEDAPKKIQPKARKDNYTSWTRAMERIRLASIQPTPAPTRPNQPESFTLQEIRAVKILLEASGGSLVEAQKKLNRLFVALQENP